MKKTLLIIFGSILLFCIVFYTMVALAVVSPLPEACYIQREKIIKITENSSKDIVFSDSHGDHYYINRGLERGLNLDSLRAKVLNKSVTLHLAKLMGGMITSEHISQLALENEIIFTEFK